MSSLSNDATLALKASALPQIFSVLFSCSDFMLLTSLVHASYMGFIDEKLTFLLLPQKMWPE